MMVTYLVIAVVSLSQITEITKVRVPNNEICHKMIDNYVTEALKNKKKPTRTYLCVDRDESDKGGEGYATE
tara:strand:- start:1673 stop:1885 length:213 start_codon:yes stop_codon:yes gene_type:complete